MLPGPWLSANPLQALGNQFFLVNSRCIPSYALAALAGDGDVNPVLTYTLIACELFLATLFFASCFRLPMELGLFTAWLLPLLSLPYAVPPAIYPLSVVAPWWLDQLAAALIMIGLFHCVGQGRKWLSVSAALLIGILGFWLLVSSLFAITIMPMLAVAVIAELAAAPSKERRVKVLTLFVLGIGALPGALPYLLGSYLFTVPRFFSAELQPDGWDLTFVSILFQGSNYHGHFGPFLVVGAALGGCVAWFAGPRSPGIRRLALLGLVADALLIAAGILVLYGLPSYSGPPPAYFEVGIWPFLCVSFAHLVLMLGQGIAWIIRWWLAHFEDSTKLTVLTRWSIALMSLSILAGLLADSFPGWKWPFIVLSFVSLGLGLARLSNFPLRWLVGHCTSSPKLAAAQGWCLAVLVLPALVVASSFHEVTSFFDPFRFPPVATPLVQVLQEDLALRPGGTFRGSVATFTRCSPEGSAWANLYWGDMSLCELTGNEHRAFGLWYYNIPTLHEYNQLMTPTFYLMTTRMLARPEDSQRRTVVVLTKPDIAYLRSLGVRYMITDEDRLAAGVSLRQSIPAGDSAALYLYELEAPNLATYAPTEVHIAPTAAQALDRLMQPGFSFETEAVVERALFHGQADPPALVRPSTVEFRVQRGCFEIEAFSAGTSLLLLPLQYSRCLQLRVRAITAGAAEPCLVRLNLMQAGLLFSGEARLEIHFAHDPFANPYGRLRDYFDSQALRIDQTCRRRAEARPSTARASRPE
jgi:hypothetical protein